MNNTSNLAFIGTDPELFEVFYREHVEVVQRFVARRLDDPHTAADLAADIFLAVIQGAAGYRPSLGPPRAWLFGIARNVVSMEHRRQARHLQALDRVGGRRVLQPDAIERALERIDAEQEARGLHRRIQALSPGLRAVFELVVVDQLSVADAAAVLKISAGTARVRLHRARRQLNDADTLTTPATLPKGASS